MLRLRRAPRRIFLHHWSHLCPHMHSMSAGHLLTLRMVRGQTHTLAHAHRHTVTKSNQTYVIYLIYGILSFGTFRIMLRYVMSCCVNVYEIYTSTCLEKCFLWYFSGERNCKLIRDEICWDLLTRIIIRMRSCVISWPLEVNSRCQDVLQPGPSHI